MNIFLNIIKQTTLAVAFVIVFTAALVTLPPKMKQWHGLEQQRNGLLRRMDYTNHEISMLKIKQQRFLSDPEFVEQVSRHNRRVRPGELVFVFESDPVD